MSEPTQGNSATELNTSHPLNATHLAAGLKSSKEGGGLAAGRATHLAAGLKSSKEAVGRGGELKSSKEGGGLAAGRATHLAAGRGGELKSSREDFALRPTLHTPLMKA